ncbi:MAG: orotidine-5'-phosphate decarboxylase [Bacteroidia bacterium]|nr:orotidine-5'-phosphate decarboxylase [Bacteroidia bacterium]MCX7652271.1 orotidine-5'-phosphate decarboxylase [Bacteroidia bacterium]MDW8416533.1 orotidine-5'-phosphate decarboxylase [Bacteroidia bacterium]
MTPQELEQAARGKNSLLCVALDPSEAALGYEDGSSPERAEARLHSIIEYTAPYAIAYKLNTAFYERWGAAGWTLMKRLRSLLPTDTLSIADAKRGDIAHTNRYYAQALYEDLGFDAVTLHPYMGWHALEPFWSYQGKWAFILLRTTEAPAWQRVIWRQILLEEPKTLPANIGWVWAAHHTDAELLELRQNRPTDWLLMPGLGAQGAQLPSTNLLYPALLVVGRALLQRPEEAQTWASLTARYLPQS